MESRRNGPQLSSRHDDDDDDDTLKGDQSDQTKDSVSLL